MQAKVESAIRAIQQAQEHVMAVKAAFAPGHTGQDKFWEIEIDDVELALGWALKKLERIRKEAEPRA